MKQTKMEGEQGYLPKTDENVVRPAVSIARHIEMKRNYIATLTHGPDDFLICLR